MSSAGRATVDPPTSMRNLPGCGPDLNRVPCPGGASKTRSRNKMRGCMLRLGMLSVDPPLVLAPMAGITDHLYRLMLRRIGGVGLVTMAVISSEAIARGRTRQLAKMFFSDEERPVSIQI